MKERFEVPKAANDNQKISPEDLAHVEKAMAALDRIDELFSRNTSGEQLFYKTLKFSAFEHIQKITIPADEEDPRYKLLKRFNEIQRLGREKGLE